MRFGFELAGTNNYTGYCACVGGVLCGWVLVCGRVCVHFVLALRVHVYMRMQSGEENGEEADR